MRKLSREKIVEGFGSTLVIMPNKKYGVSYQSKSATESWQQDWENVGKSFFQALNTYKENVSEEK